MLIRLMRVCGKAYYSLGDYYIITRLKHDMFTVCKNDEVFKNSNLLIGQAHFRYKNNYMNLLT